MAEPAELKLLLTAVLLLAAGQLSLGLPLVDEARSWGLLQPVVDMLWARAGGWWFGPSSSRVSYRGHQVLRAWPRTSRHVQALLDMSEDLDGLRLWSLPARNRSADMLVPPDSVQEVKDFLEEQGVEFSVLIKDLQKSIANQNPKISKEERMELRGSKGHDMTFRRYHRYSDMLRYIDHLAMAHADLVEVRTIGKSSGGLPLKVVKVASGGPHTKSGVLKSAVWIDGGTHGREWISPAVVMFVLKQLVENRRLNRQLVEEAEWYLLPVANPDGYEYSHTTDRLWRKTRSNHDGGGSSIARTITSLLFGSCDGVDLNRNWDFHWGEKGASDDPCHDTYAGPRAFSEPESAAISQFLMDHKDRVRLYLSLHSYAQMWLLPWGFTSKRAPDHEDMYAMGLRAVDALTSVAGTEYGIGPSMTMLYPTSGSSDDWAKGVAGIKYAYTVELPDKGHHGFMLPASRIIPTGKETFAAIKSLAKAIVCKS